jgi:ETC complex I subunit conserved region
MIETAIRPNHNRPPLAPLVGHAIWPEGAVARIHRPSRSVTTSGEARTKKWVLCFERRTPPEIEPLMGWTGSDDTLTQVELTFDTLQEAIAYAEREGLAYRIEGEAIPATAEERRQAAAAELYATTAALAWMDAQYGIGAVGRRPDLDRALVNPAAVYGSPREVLNDPSLTMEDKREVLRRWAWDAWLLEVAADEAMIAGEPSRYDEVKAALLALDRLERTPVLVVANPASGQAQTS